MEKQIDLLGKSVEAEETENLGLWKSVLQKSIRRGWTEKAMYSAWKLCKMNSWSLWKRLAVIADEDVGQPEAITAVDVLYRKFMAMKKNSKELNWDAKRCVVCAAKILAEAPKDRRADEFLELMDAFEKHGENMPELKELKEEMERVPDEALDMHTKEGRKMGRGLLYWYEISSETVNKTEQYEKWHRLFKPLMIELTKAKEKKKQ